MSNLALRFTQNEFKALAKELYEQGLGNTQLRYTTDGRIYVLTSSDYTMDKVWDIAENLGLKQARIDYCAVYTGSDIINVL